MEENNPDKQKSPPTIAIASRAGTKFLLICLLLALVKIWVISSDEIIAYYYPHDDLWYIHSAKEWYWLGPYSNATFQTPPFVRLPAYPLFIAVTKLMGLPLRISIELLLLAAALVFAICLIKAGQTRLIAVLAYAAIIFHPASFHVNSRAGTDSFYGPMLLLVLACMIISLVRKDDIHPFRYAFLTGIVLAILWHVRQESLILLGLLAVYGLIALWLVGVSKRRWRSTFRKLSVMVLVPASVVLIVSLTINTINFMKFGVFAADAMSAPGFVSASKALLRIKPNPPVRFIAVPREVRQRAYLVSPSFRELESYMEGEPGRSWESFAKESGVPVENEMSTGHFWWALNSAAYEAGYNRSAGHADRFFQRVGNEINAACNDGRLQCRWVLSSVLDPHRPNYLPYFPASLRRMSGLFFDTYGPARERDSPYLASHVTDIFDEMANRRTTANTSDTKTLLSGWALVRNDSLQRILVRDQTGILASIEQFIARPDVVSGYAAQGITVQLNSGYHLEVPPTAQNSTFEIVFITKSGKELVVPHTHKLSGIATIGPLVYAVDQDETLSKSFDYPAVVQRYIGATYAGLTVFLTYLGLAALVVLLLCYRVVNLRETVYWLLALLGATVMIRLAFFTLIDASSYSATQIRYLFPVVPLYTCILLLLIAQGVRAATTLLNRYGIIDKIEFRKTHRNRNSAPSG